MAHVSQLPDQGSEASSSRPDENFTCVTLLKSKKIEYTAFSRFLCCIQVYNGIACSS
jgi:hypothetical protein